MVSPAADADAVEDAIARLVLELAAEHEITAVGIGAAGYVDAGRAVVMFAPNIAWRDEDLRPEIQARVHLPVVVENDANAAAWGEFAFGAAADVDDMLMVTVGTGVGGGIVTDGSLFRGGVRRGRRDRPPARRARRPAVRLRQPRLPRAVRQRLGPGPRDPGPGPDPRGRGRCSSAPAATRPPSTAR